MEINIRDSIHANMINHQTIVLIIFFFKSNREKSFQMQIPSAITIHDITISDHIISHTEAQIDCINIAPSKRKRKDRKKICKRFSLVKLILSTQLKNVQSISCHLFIRISASLHPGRIGIVVNDVTTVSERWQWKRRKNNCYSSGVVVEFV